MNFPNIEKNIAPIRGRRGSAIQSGPDCLTIYIVQNIILQKLILGARPNLQTPAHDSRPPAGCAQQLITGALADADRRRRAQQLTAARTTAEACTTANRRAHNRGGVHNSQPPRAQPPRAQQLTVARSPKPTAGRPRQSNNREESRGTAI